MAALRSDFNVGIQYVPDAYITTSNDSVSLKSARVTGPAVLPLHYCRPWSPAPHPLTQDINIPANPRWPVVKDSGRAVKIYLVYFPTSVGGGADVPSLVTHLQFPGGGHMSAGLLKRTLGVEDSQKELPIYQGTAPSWTLNKFTITLFILYWWSNSQILKYFLL